MEKIEIGATIASRYRVLAELGRGEMTDVYRVRDEHRRVDLALKLLRSHYAQDLDFLQRLKRKAHNLSGLDHPGIVRFLGVEQDAQSVYLLLENINGEDLNGEIARSQPDGLTPSRILEISKSICSALHYAHQKRVIHGDLTPANILVDGKGAIFVTDFAIARLRDPSASLVDIGKAAYLAPELLQGQDPIPQTDVYSMGVLLCELFTGGEGPFTGGSPQTVGTTSETSRWEPGEGALPPLSRYNQNVSLEVQKIIGKCLLKDPFARFASMAELQAALEAGLKNDLTPLPASSQTSFEGAWPPGQVGLNRIDQQPPAEYRGVPEGRRTVRSQPDSQLRKAILPLTLTALAAIIGTFYLTRPSTSPEEHRPSSFPSPTQWNEILSPPATSSLDPVSTQPALPPTPAIFPVSPLPTPTLRPPSSTPTEVYVCPGATPFPSGLQVGDRAYVCTRSDNLLLRAQPHPSSEEILRYPTGTLVEIVGGPHCFDHDTWWRVRLKAGTLVRLGSATAPLFALSYPEEGWTREGSDRIDMVYLCRR